MPLVSPEFNSDAVGLRDSTSSDEMDGRRELPGKAALDVAADRSTPAWLCTYHHFQAGS